MVYQLSKPAFVPISNNGTVPTNANFDSTIPSFGGDQGWFVNTSNVDSTIANYITPKGCGLISSTNLLLHMQRSISEYKNITSVTATNNVISYDEYIDFVLNCYNDYFKIKSDFDTNGIKLANGLNKYFKDEKNLKKQRIFVLINAMIILIKINRRK